MIEKTSEHTTNEVIKISSVDDLKRVAMMMNMSQLFSSKTQNNNQAIAEACVKIMAGQEMGIAPFAAMNGFNIINNKPEMSANLLATLVKRHPFYDYRVKENTATKCVIEMMKVSGKKNEVIGISEFTIEEAQKAKLVGKAVWQMYPKAMLFARALSQGVRMHAPDITSGTPVYVDGEISGSDPIDVVSQTNEVETVTEKSESPKLENEKEVGKSVSPEEVQQSLEIDKKYNQ